MLSTYTTSTNSYVIQCVIACYISKEGDIYVANAGDCRAIIGTKGIPTCDTTTTKVHAVPLSNDHNCKHPHERMKLEALHPNEDNIVKCKPNNPEACYVKGRLQPTRALGDLYLKYSEFNGPSAKDRTRGRHIPPPYTPPYITAEPEVIKRPRNTNDQFMVIGKTMFPIHDDDAVILCFINYSPIIKKSIYSPLQHVMACGMF